MTALRDQLIALNACSDAIEWVGDRDLPTAWRECERADWLLWICAKQIGKSGWADHQTVVRMACDCAERSLRFVPAGEDRPRLAIEAARRWADDPTEENLDAAGAAAWAARAAAWATGAAGAARAAWAARAAAWAAWDAARAAAWAAGDAGDAEHRAMCEMIRERFTPPAEEGKP